jgi:hypothetical protein
MKKIVYGLWLTVYGIFLLSTINYQLSTISYAQQAVSSTELIEHAKELDGKEVVYEGEAIGEVMARKGGVWVNLHDGENAIGIWIDNNLLNPISYTGNYKARGDWLQIRGIFNRACKVHGADLDIHALNVIKLREGRIVKHRMVPQKQRLVFILSGVLLCLMILSLLGRKLKKK